jgi:hypothetical protein
MLRRFIFVPCSLMNLDPSAREIKLCRIMYAASGPVALPVAGSSAMPCSGANIREYAPSGLGANTKTPLGRGFAFLSIPTLLTCSKRDHSVLAFHGDKKEGIPGTHYLWFAIEQVAADES